MLRPIGKTGNSFLRKWQQTLHAKFNFRESPEQRASAGSSDTGCLPKTGTTADVRDRNGAKLLLDVLTMAFGWLILIWADGG
ncbi:MAG: hypothetical protein ABI162_02775 [Luteolibacter sp.]